MALNKPYFRIWRPLKSYSDAISAMFEDDSSEDDVKYLLDDSYANQAELKSLVTATRMILYDVHELFNYVEPCDANEKVYSHRLYELLLRAATEFETNCKAILEANHYSSSRNLNITDYYKLNRATKLADYKIVFHCWQDAHEWKPFDEWNVGHSLSWYHAYNQVKHNRLQNFSEANLENVMNAVASLICILHVQISDNVGDVALNGMSPIPSSQYEVDCNTFRLIVPTFNEEDMYDFKWSILKAQPDPVLDYPF